MSEAHFADSVRLALPNEADAIVAVQLDWLTADPQLAKIADALDVEQMRQAWYEAITKPPLANYRVLVAIDASRKIVGFCAIGPSDDPDAEPQDGLIAEFCVHPSHTNKGHEDRLMHAAIDTLRADDFTMAYWWVRSTDDRLRQLLHESGWAPDGAHRELADDSEKHLLKQIRMVTALV